LNLLYSIYYAGVISRNSIQHTMDWEKQRGIPFKFSTLYKTLVSCTQEDEDRRKMEK